MDINPITGKPINDPKKPVKPGSTVANQSGTTTTVGNTIPPRKTGFDGVNPLTGMQFATPKSDLIYTGINASKVDFSRDITDREGKGSAAEALKDGIDPFITDDWREQRAKNQSGAAKLASTFFNKIPITAISTAGEAFFGSTTGAIYSTVTGFSGKGVEKDKQLRAYMASYMNKDSRYALNPDMLNQSDNNFLSGLATIMGGFSNSQSVPYDEEVIKQRILDEIWGPSGTAGTSSFVYPTPEGKEELQKQLAAQGITKDNIFQALAEQRDIQNSVLGIRPSSFGGSIGYNAPGSVGAGEMLGKYKKAVEEATRKYIDGSPDGNYMRDVAAAYWDTPLGNAMDAFREWGDKTFPYLYTREEEELAAKSVNWVPFTDGSFNFYFDKLASGVGFAAGAFAPALLTKGKGIGAVTYRTAKNMFSKSAPNAVRAASALEAEAAATQTIASGEGAAEMAASLRGGSILSKFKNNFKNYQKVVASSYLASYAEAAVESRDVKKQFIKQEVEKWMAENPGKTEADIPPELMVRIEMVANNAGNTNFAMQMPMLMATNLFTLGSIMKFKAMAPLAQRLGVTAEEGVQAARLTGEAGKVTEKFWFNTKGGRFFEKTVRKAGKIAPAAISEGAQEGFQYFSQKYSLGYYADRIVDDEVHLGQNYAEALNKTLNDTESIEQMVIGAMIGGGMSAYANRSGSELGRENKKATETVKAIMNSGVLSNMVQRAEMSSESKAIAKDYAEKLKAGDTNGARDALFKLISSEASIAEQFGSKDMYNEMLDDLANMSPEDFAEFAMPEASEEFKKNLTKDQIQEIVGDVKTKFNRAAEIRKGIIEKFPLPQRSTGLDRLGMSQAKRDDEELRIQAMSAYRDILYSTAIDLEGIDGTITALIENLQAVVPSLDINLLRMKVKAGEVKAAEDGKKVSIEDVQSVMATAVDKKTQEQLGLYLRSLNPEQREQVLSDFSELINLAGKRNIALNAYEELRKNPGKSTLYYKALQADRQEKTRAYRQDVARQVLETATSSRSLINSLPIIESPLTRDVARKKIKELQAKESRIRKDKFADMTVEEMHKLDYNSMSDIEKVAYDTALVYKKNKEIRQNIKNRVTNTLRNNPSGVYSMDSLFKGMSKDKQGEAAMAATSKQVQDTLQAEGVNATVTNVGITFDRKSDELVAIATYTVEGDPNPYTYVIPVSEVAVLKDSEQGLREMMADDIAAKRTARIAKGDTEDAALEERQQQLEDLLQQEINAAHPTVSQAHKLLTNVETITHQINGQTIQAPTGRRFIISNKEYENTFSYIMDAVNFTPDGEAVSVTLFDVQAQEFKTFRKRKADEVEAVDAIYQQLLLAEAFAQMTGMPGARPQDEQQSDEEITDTFIKLAKDTIEHSSYSTKVADMVSEDLRSQLLDLQNHVRNLNGRLDRIYSVYASEGKTLEEANRDNKVKELKQLMAAITKLANDRRAQLTSRREVLELNLKTLNDKIDSLTAEVDQLSTNRDEVQKQIDGIREVLESGVYDAVNNIDDAREVAKAQKTLEQATQLLSYLSRKIEDKTKQINQYKDEIDILLGRRKISSETSEAAAAREIAEGENLRTGEASEDTGLDAVNTSHENIVERQNNEIDGQNQASNGTTVDQAGGQINTTSTPSFPSTGNTEVDNNNAVIIESGADLSLDIQLVKGEYATDDNYNIVATVNPDGTVTTRSNDTRRDSRIVVNESGQQIGVIEDNRKLLSNPAMFAAGTEVVFEVREDTKWWQSDKGKSAIPEDKHWEQVPIFVKAITRKTDAEGNETISTEYISLLSAYNPESPDGYKGNARKLIYEAYKKGGKVTSTIKDKEFTTGAKGNIINLRTANDEVVFVNPMGEDGIGFRFDKGSPIKMTPTVAIAVGMETVDEEGNPTEVTRKFELGNTKGLMPEEISKMGDALNTALSFYKTLTDAGIAVFVIQDPRGNYRAIPAVTRKLTKEAQKQALSALGKRDLVTFKEIVGTNIVRVASENFLEVEAMEKAWGATDEAEGIRVTFYSASAKSLVSVQYDRLLQAIKEQELTGKSELPFSFTVVEQTPEGGKNFKSASREKSEFGQLKSSMVSDFLAVLANKRYQVDKALLQTNDPYVSKVTGKQYPSYTDYLFSDVEATEERESGIGSKAILATNVANNNYGSAFFDIGVSFTDIKVNGVGVEVKEEMRARQFEEPVSAPPASTASVTSGISLSLPPLPGMPPIQSNPSNAPAPATPPAAPVSNKKADRIIEAKFAEQETQFYIEVKGENRDFLLTWSRNSNKPTLWGEKQPDGTYKTTIEYPTEEEVKKLVDKYVPEKLLDLINKWTAASKLPAGQVLDAQDKIAREIEKELAALEQPTTPAVTQPAKTSTDGKVSPQRMQEIINGLESGNMFIFDFKGEELEAARAYVRGKLEAKVAATPASDTTGLTPAQLGINEAPTTIRIKGALYLTSEVNAKMLEKLGISNEEANDILNSICK